MYFFNRFYLQLLISRGLTLKPKYSNRLLKVIFFLPIIVVLALTNFITILIMLLKYHYFILIKQNWRPFSCKGSLLRVKTDDIKSWDIEKYWD